jgi:uncharacterized lipoprotein NlpE involved in copper resistance
MIKRAILTVCVAFCFILVGCQNSEPSEPPSSADENSETGSPSGAQDSTLPILETEYGRGAQSDGEDTNAQEEPARILSDALIA